VGGLHARDAAPGNETIEDEFDVGKTGRVRRGGGGRGRFFFHKLEINVLFCRQLIELAGGVEHGAGDDGAEAAEIGRGQAAEALVVMTAPVAPHIAEELWSKLGHPETLTFADFPKADPALLVDATVTCIVQVQGKVRDRLEVPADIGDEDLQARALAREKIVSALAGKLVRKVIVRAPNLVNVVTS